MAASAPRWFGFAVVTNSSDNAAPRGWRQRARRV